MNFNARILMALNSIDQRLDLIEQRLDANDEELVGIGEACKILRCTRDTIYKRIQRGQLQCAQGEGIKGRYKFRRKYLLELTKQVQA